MLGLRDILDASHLVRYSWTQEGVYGTLEQLYHLILVYGAQELFDIVKEYALSPTGAQRVHFCGYLDRLKTTFSQSVATHTDLRDTDLRRELAPYTDRLVVLTAGGGGDGFPLMQAYLLGLGRLEKPTFTSVLVTGPLMEANELRMLCELAATLPAGTVRIESFLPNPLLLFAAADLVVSMAGYNTVCELLALGQRTLLVPRFTPRKEQLVRATLLAERVVGMLSILLIINPLFGVLGLVIALFVYFVLRWYLRKLKQMARQMRRQDGDANAIAQENLLGIRVVQAFGMEAHAQQLYEEGIRRSLLQLGVSAARLRSGLPSTVGLLTDLGNLLVLVTEGVLVMQGRISIGDLLVFSAFLRILYSPMRQLGKLSDTFTRASASAERVMDLLQTAPAVVDRPTVVPAPQLRGTICFQHVSFGYDPQHHVLHDTSFNIRPGKMVALVGYTGAGKSSILHLIQRFYDPQKGQICIDGRDIRDYTLASLRQQIALVPQDPMLFRTSVRENIAYGCPQATEAEIIAAAQAAYADTFIRQLPEGYQTILGERGVGLSGGERQRLAIARAMVRQAPLLLLDEPTVALDAQAEQIIVQALERLMVGRTTLVIAHRLSTIQRADLVLVIDKGRIVEVGTPAELLAAGGHYYQLYRLQF
ncbi:MAG: ATP-binding cassette domain-containing protein [Ktedonobacteraceae bacterium]